MQNLVSRLSEGAGSFPIVSAFRGRLYRIAGAGVRGEGTAPSPPSSSGARHMYAGTRKIWILRNRGMSGSSHVMRRHSGCGIPSARCRGGGVG